MKKSKIVNIVTGISKNMLNEFNLLSDEDKDISNKRLSICNECSLKGKKRCLSSKKGAASVSFYYIDEDEDRTKGALYNGCGCYLISKSMSNSQCPLGKWENII